MTAIANDSAVGMPSATVPWFGRLYVQVLLGIALGSLIGYLWPDVGTALKPLGDALIKMIKMAIAPIVFLTVVHGIASLGDMRKAGRIGLKALIYFEVTTTIALILGLIVINLTQPGVGMHVALASLDAKLVASYVAQSHDQSVVSFLMNIIPSTVGGAFTNGDTLQVLFFAVLFGIALQRFGDRGKPVLDLIEQLSKIFFILIGMIMQVAPIGAFGAIAFTIGKYGAGTIVSLSHFMLTFYVTCLLFVFVGLGIVARLAGFSILKLIRYLREELLLVLGLSGSESVMPRFMVKMTVAGCSESTVGLVVPTGYTFNLDGTCIYLTMAAVFLAQATDTPLTIVHQIVLVAVCLLTSKGAAAIPGSGFIVLAATLGTIGHVPVASIALLLGIDRFMSEARALTNFIGTAVATVVISKWEGELDTQQFAHILDNPDAVKLSF
ncbi:dicarboxylate/amino acid:cation symporter [Bradyrhizobium sp. LTSPM299]|uniref:dicarboxylate/amino acid:cation symporter n=1 Tax=Bradyrhizobium sp. LTSPM299 TaxID=1619233 RepID=UPI000679D2A2|nr:dicarboxylate/amino acid:cation symporter [Bradyrhizobium sp. LTSPM299]